MTKEERIAEACKDIEREVRSGGYCDGHYRSWDFIMYYTRAKGLAEIMEALVGKVQQAKRDKQRMDSKWWEKEYEPIKKAIRMGYYYGPELVITQADRDIYNKFCDARGFRS